MKHPRRRWLGMSAALVATQMTGLRSALAAGSVKKGVYRIEGKVLVNDSPARVGMDIKAGDSIATGAASSVVFVAHKDAFILRANTRIETQGTLGELIISGMRIVTGAVLSVYAPGKRKTLYTTTAIIGIRGTAIYIEVEAARAYVCLCYGEADITSTADPAIRETLRTTHHEQPRYVLGPGAAEILQRAPMINHTDAELIMLESLVGRSVPFLNSPMRY